MALKLKQLNSRYSRSLDLINVGAYEAGTDPILDEAIRKHEKIATFLQQDISERASLNDSITQLENLLNS